MFAGRFHVLSLRTLITTVAVCILFSAGGCIGTSDTGLPPGPGEGGVSDSGAPALSVDSVNHDFGSVVLGQQSGPTAFILTNSGNAATGALTVTVGGGDATSFAVVTDECTGKSLAASGGRCAVVIQFKPAGEGGAKSGTLTMAASPGGATTTKLTGTAIAGGAISMSPDTHDFGPTPFGQTGAPFTFTVKNTGGSQSGILAVNTTGSDRTQFIVSSDNCSGTSLAAGATCTLAVAAIPSGLGEKAATLVATASPGGSASSSLVATGIEPGVLSITPASQDFSGVVVGASSADTTFTVKNTGFGTTGVPAFALTGANATDFVFGASTCTTPLAPGATCTVKAHFTPSATGSKTATLNVGATPGGSAASSLSGTGLAPASLAIDRASRDFGSIVQNTVSADVSFTISNGGGVASGVPAVSMSGANASEFVVTSNQCMAAIPAGGSCVVKVHFAPSALGSRAATLQVTASPGGTVTSSLQGTGVAQGALSVAPSSHPYPAILINTTTADFDFTVSNTGGVPTGIPTVAVNGSDASQFVIASNTCTAALAPSASCLVRMHFAPTSPGSKSASLQISANPGGTTIASVTGTGLGPALLTVVPNSQPFGSIVDGTSTAPQDFTVMNTGGVASGTMTASLGGTNPAEFQITSDACSTTALAPNATCIVRVRFNPTTPGGKSATLSVTANPGGTALATLTGTGLAPALLGIDFASHDYGSIVIASNSADFDFVVTNGGGVPSGVPSATLAGANAGDFQIASNGCTAALPSGGSCTVRIHFRPTAQGARAARLDVVASPGGTVSADLTGTGLTPGNLTISTNNVPFGSIVVNTQTADTPITITNTGGGPTGLPAVTLGGTDASQFIMSNGCTAVLGGGASCIINVRFAPTTTGTKAASITVSAAPGGTVAATLGGTSLADAFLTIATSPTDFGDETVNLSTSDVTFTVRNTGGVASGVPAISIGGMNPGDFVIGTNGCTAALAPSGGSCTVTAHFLPLAAGNRSATLSAAASPGGTAVANLLGRGLTVASLSVSPGNNPFPDTTVGAASADFAFTVTNGGQSSTGNVAFTLGGTDPGDFRIGTTTCPTQIPGGTSCTVNVHFLPGTAGTKSARLDATASPGGTASANVSGNALTPALLTLSPAPYTFPDQVVRSTSVGVPFTVTNVGQTTSGVVSATFPSSPDFIVASNTCTTALAFNQTCVVTIQFSPQTTGAKSGTLTATASPGGTPTSLVSGNALSPANLAMQAPTSQDFGTTAVGIPSLTQNTYTVVNDGGVPTGALSTTLGGTNAGDYSIVSDQCQNQQLGSGLTCNVVLRFTPQDAGPSTATITVSGAPGGSAQGTMTGMGIGQ